MDIATIVVPITYMDKYCPEQFEILNCNDYRVSEDVPEKPHGLIKDKEGTITLDRDSKGNIIDQPASHRTVYARMLIKKIR